MNITREAVATAKKVIFFVYGTLKQGFGNHYGRLNGDTVTYLGEFATEPKFTMVSAGGFPAVHCEGDTSIKGELYETSDPDVIRSVNGLEGYSGTPSKDGGDNWYDVEPLETPYGTALMFVWRKPITRQIVKDGIWK